MLGSRSTQTDARSPVARKAPLVHPGVLVLAGCVILFGAYALGYLPQFGSLLEDAIRSNRSSDTPVLTPAYYGIAGLAAFLILLGLLRSFDLVLRKLRNGTPLKTRPAKGIEAFIEEATSAEISRRVAREGYYLLEAHYPYRMCIDLNDGLRSELRLDDEAIEVLAATLLTRCDRRKSSAARTKQAGPSANTVFDLLHLAETAPELRADRSGSRERTSDLTVPDGPSEKRNSDSAQRKALHAATLIAIESGSLRAHGDSGDHRRSTDYKGLRRRATDIRVDPEFKGPFRRATDRPAPPASERKAQPVPDPAELNRRDPLFVPPLNKRVPESTR